MTAYRHGPKAPFWTKLAGLLVVIASYSATPLHAGPPEPEPDSQPTPLGETEPTVPEAPVPDPAPTRAPPPETSEPGIQGIEEPTEDLGEAAPEGPESYVDQLIGEELTDEELAALEVEELAVPGTGRESLTTEYRLFHQNITDIDPEFENGLAAFWRKETIDYGTISVDVLGKYVINDLSEDGENRTGASFTLRQDEFALTNRLQMDNFLGDSRAVTNPLVSHTFRFQLPSSIIRGASSALYSDKTEFRLTGGQVGRLDGIATPTFENIGDTLWGLGLTHEFEKNMSFGLQGWSLIDNPQIPNHESLAGAIQYDNSEARQRHQLHSLYDTTGNLGFWYDGDSWVKRWRHRYGLFRFAPGLLWTDVQIANDRQGLYWRGENRSFRRDWNVAIDYVETNIDADPTLAGRELYTGFLSTGWRVRRNTRLGGIMNLAFQRPGEGLPSDSTDAYRLTGYIDQGSKFGQSRLQLVLGKALNDQNPDIDNYQVTWDQGWAVPSTHRLGTTVSYEREEENGDNTDRTTLQSTYGRDITSNLNVNGTVNFVMLDGDTAGKNRALNFNFGLFWQFLRDWSANFSINYDRNVTEPPGGTRFTLEDTRVFFTLRRTQISGGAPVVYGRQTGEHGKGRLVGRVFMDENRDGRWQPSEPGIPGLTVYLDGRFAGQTDPDGRYEMWPVAAGEHQVFIALEDVPLPWGLVEETPRRFQVLVRDATEIDFPLVRLDQ